MTYEHSPECAAAIQEREALREAYAITWPEHCPKCEGWGMTGYSEDPSPAGVSLGPGKIDYVDPCPECAEKGRCPRCGSVAMSKEGDECFRCGWTFRSEGMPPPEECTCWDRMPDVFDMFDPYGEDDDFADLGEQVDWDRFYERGY